MSEADAQRVESGRIGKPWGLERCIRRGKGRRGRVLGTLKGFLAWARGGKEKF